MVYDLYTLLELRQLTHLYLNDLNFADPNSSTFVHQQVLDLVNQNPGVTHLGLNGIQIEDPYSLFNSLSSDLVSLELSNTGLDILPVPVDQYEQLEILDLSYNPSLTFDFSTVTLFSQAETLKQLNLS